jgi:N-acetylglucosaminyl-diphospho-decaprenol L-rhamnosyltransferase
MLSVIIVNYKSEKYLAACLSSIKEKLLNVDYEIIVVNNDDTNIQCPDAVKIINSGKNIGFGAACNLGAEEARGETLLFLNPDTEIVSNNIAELIKKFENKKLAAIGPRLITEDKKTQAWCVGRDISFWQLLKNNLGVVDSKKIWESERETQTDWISGAALFLRKKDFERADGFDEKYFMYAEDMDLCRKIRMLGQDVVYAPQFVVLHKGGKSRDNFLKQKIQFFKSSLRYLTKWM